MAEEFAVSRMTIRKAIDLLVAWGLVVRRHGREKRSPARC
ncbi:HTH-type transcriptional regulator YidP [Klebsiella pneumoniae IS22]|nr:HTH-type transcriptional regulator YidP [Klebsiella pneumoniae IS22]